MIYRCYLSPFTIIPQGNDSSSASRALWWLFTVYTQRSEMTSLYDLGLGLATREMRMIFRRWVKQLPILRQARRYLPRVDTGVLASLSAGGSTQAPSPCVSVHFLLQLFCSLGPGVCATPQWRMPTFPTDPSCHQGWVSPHTFQSVLIGSIHPQGLQRVLVPHVPGSWISQSASQGNWSETSSSSDAAPLASVILLLLGLPPTSLSVPICFFSVFHSFCCFF